MHEEKPTTRNVATFRALVTESAPAAMVMRPRRRAMTTMPAVMTAIVTVVVNGRTYQ